MVHTKFNVKAATTGIGVAAVQISMRAYESIGHLSAASFFANRSKAIEDAKNWTTVTPLERREHRACVTSAVVLSVAFLEATINELFSDVADQHSTHYKLPLSKDVNAIMGNLWNRERGFPRSASYSILEKYEIALVFADKPAMAKGSGPLQAVKALIDLRNALVHFEPETVVSHPVPAQDKAHKFEKSLRGKFETSGVMAPGNPFYPDKLLGAGCAKWCVQSAVAFADDFFSLLEVKPAYDHVRSEYGLTITSAKGKPKSKRPSNS